MTAAFGSGGTVLTHRPIKAAIEIYPGQDLECFLRVPPGGEPWPDGTTVELRFYDGPDATATLIDTYTCDVDPQFVHARVESTDLEALPSRAVFAFYASLPTSPTTDYLIVTGITSDKKRGK